MLTRANFVDKIEREKILAAYLREGRIGLVLGSGISLPLGLPDWKGLIKGLYKKHRIPFDSGMSPTRAAGELERRLFMNRRPEFYNEVRATLYDGVQTDFASLRGHHTLAAIASVAMLLQSRGEAEIITFNFDDLLELYLRFHGFRVTPVHFQPDWAGRQGIVVYHPHGYLPQTGETSLDLTFTDNSYEKLSQNSFRPFRQQILCTLRSRLCLFIGVSGEDPHLNRLLSEVKRTHVARNENAAFWGVAFAKDPNAAFVRNWERNGVYVAKVKDFDEDLAVQLFRICQVSSSLN